MNKAILREYDIRGHVEKDLTDEVVLSIGRAFATLMQENGKKKASIGRDCRLTSEHYRNLIVQGMVEGGLEVIDLGIVPTPLFYFSLFNYDVEGGIMVTGSHNPPEYNGFKIAIGKSTIFGDKIKYVGKIIEEKRFVKGNGNVRRYDGIIEDYYNFLRKDIKLSRRFKVVVDAGNGTGGYVACPIMKEFGQEVVELYCDMDGRFPNHFPDPTIESYMEKLKETVVNEKADCGIGYDGDADRIGVIDDKGNIIWGDYLMIIFARDILRERKGAYFVSEVKCSRNLFEDIEKHGGKAIMWKAGHSLIKQKMKEVGALLAGEMSGHMFFADRYFGYDDAIYSSLRLLEILEKEGKPLSELLSDVPRTYATPEIRLDCPDEIKFSVIEKLKDLYKKQFQVIDIDGVRVVFKEGWGLARPSNTQPVIVLRFEAESEESLKRIRDMVEDDLREIMKEYGY
ncbi:MAG: phosphomannomutase/phosphoglucomutase [Deltaproteobacteria bacterium]|nr:phosphomannomutase/phosphoglucomutase [Deltaproteobacteria bacterium]